MSASFARRPRMLLHVCCAPCSPYVADRLRREYDLSLYFYNPNIHPEDEYMARTAQVRRWAVLVGLPLFEGEYDADSWFGATAGLENEPEKGKRCVVCFHMRLSRVADKAAELGMDSFGTVLTVSPHKDAVVINRIGAQISSRHGLEFLEADWKKNDGFKLTCAMAKEMGLTRQNYCGCTYSKPPEGSC